MSKRRSIDPIPDEFGSYEEAAEFWGTHEITDYLDAFQPVDLGDKLLEKDCEIVIDEDIIRELVPKAQEMGITLSRLINNILRRQIAAG